jgi:hypothetical protein
MLMNMFALYFLTIDNAQAEIYSSAQISDQAGTCAEDRL